MQRKALLIGAPGDNGLPENKLPGVKADLNNLRNFLTSQAGGGWYQSEIDVLVDPARADVDAKLCMLKYYDYSFVFFGGHGRHAFERNKTQLCLRPDVYIEMTDLVRAGAKKHTVIADACRVFHYEITLESMKEAFATRRHDGVINNDSRVIFDQQINRCAPGVVEIYACDLNETANEEAGEGGLYTSSLVRSGVEWGKGSKEPRIMSIVSAHELAQSRVRGRSSQRQNPTVSYPRSSPHFPFAIAPRSSY